LNLLDHQNDKNSKFVIDKILGKLNIRFASNSLKAWLGEYYYDIHVRVAPEKNQTS